MGRCEYMADVLLWDTKKLGVGLGAQAAVVN